MFINDDPAISDADRVLEIQHFENVVRAFQNYRLHSLTAMAKRRRDMTKIPHEHLELVTPLLEPKLSAAEECVRKNAAVVSVLLEGHDAEGSAPAKGQAYRESRVAESDMDKVRSTLRQFARDWSSEGRLERQLTYDPILAELEQRFSHLDEAQRGNLHILVPGAGLGRLAFDIVKRGFSCQGNEFSFYMLLGSHFILNRATEVNQFELYPWIHSFSNHLNASAQLNAVRIPDVLTNGIPSTAEFSMVAGDFTEVYGTPDNEGAWDVIVTCFFIDTAKNIVDYIDIMHRALKPNGLWINLGPLLYHWEGMENEMSIELTLEELKYVVRKKGFRLENEKTIRTPYASNAFGMLKYMYDCDYFVAVKE
ncbi:N2227-domain-containing protein [Powellomyces hirtus]|nr:N2227-domain-containing protein [Powellomyces hirtus]